MWIVSGMKSPQIEEKTTALVPYDSFDAYVQAPHEHTFDLNMHWVVQYM